MNIKEKSKEYAEGKALSAITSAIEDAYVAGYNDGLKHYENEKLEAAKRGVKFKDWDLESGLSWSDDYVKDKAGVTEKMTYQEAANLDIPTIKDFQDFMSNCAINYVNETHFHGLKFTGKNGAEIKLNYEFHEGQNDKGQNCVIFWLKSEEEDNERSYAYICAPDRWMILKTFMGYKLPVVLVSKG